MGLWNHTDLYVNTEFDSFLKKVRVYKPLETPILASVLI